MITRFIQVQTEDLLRINDNHARHLYPRNSSEVGKLVLFPSLPSLQSLKGLVKSNGHGSRFGCLGGLGGWLVLYLLSKYCSCLGPNKGRHTRQVDTLVIAGALASGTSNLGCKDQASEISTSYIFPCFLHVHFVPVRNSHRFLQCLKKRASGPRLHNPFHVLGPYFSKPSLRSLGYSACRESTFAGG